MYFFKFSFDGNFLLPEADNTARDLKQLTQITGFEPPKVEILDGEKKIPISAKVE